MGTGKIRAVRPLCSFFLSMSNYLSHSGNPCLPGIQDYGLGFHLKAGVQLTKMAEENCHKKGGNH